MKKNGKGEKMSNPYVDNQPPLDIVEFLKIAYTMMKKKVERLKEIEESKKRDKLPLPLVKEKFEITSNILKALLDLTSALDYTKPDAKELADILNDIGLMLSKGNIAESKEEALKYYDIVIYILDEFLSE